MIIIREFQTADAAQASVVFFESFKTYLKERMEINAPHPAEYTESLMRHTANEDVENISFVAVEDGTVIGCITVNLALKRGLGTLIRIGVMPGNAGKGIGKMLFAAADKFWRERNTRKVRTCVSSINPGALKFYQSCGFHQEATLKDHFFEGVDEHQLALFYR
ncbi:MAG: GNAT family N-acetyltransferase [Lentisphaerae bacterium]|nr:GNAT family N-acetyltransferase [Lentisphaerota bacterium]